jgi:putative membrane protein
MRLPLLALATASLALSGCATAEGVFSRIVPPTGPEDRTRYVAAAVASDVFEIEAARLAAARAEQPAVRQFAQMLVEDHSRSLDALTDAALAYGITFTPDQVTVTQRQRLGALETAPAGSFDRVFMEQQIPAHEAAMRLHNAYALAGDARDLREFAASAVTKVHQHREHIRQILRSDETEAFDRRGWVSAAR